MDEQIYKWVLQVPIVQILLIQYWLSLEPTL